MRPSGPDTRPLCDSRDDVRHANTHSYHGEGRGYHDNKQQDFVKEWLWRRSEHSLPSSGGPETTDTHSDLHTTPLTALAGARHTASGGPDTTDTHSDLHTTPLTALAGARHKPSQNPRGRGSDVMAGQGMEYMMNRLEPRSRSTSASPSDYGSYYSQRSLLQGYDKQRCHWSGYCKAFVVITILLLVAWGVAVPLYFTVGPGTLPWDTGDTPTSQPQAQVAMVTSDRKSPNIVLNAVNCSMRIINERFNHLLQNKYSAEFQSLRVKIESNLSNIFRKDKNFKKAVVTSFSPGSVIAHLVLLFHKRRPDIKEYAHNILANHIMSQWSMLGNYRVELSSISIKYISNKCAELNGGCSHICVWTLLGEGYECQCPEDHILMTDGSTCLPKVTRLPGSTTAGPLCGDDHFLCKRGSCIPRQWLCDGVPDCLLAEDEKPHICPKRIQPVAARPQALYQHYEPEPPAYPGNHGNHIPPGIYKDPGHFHPKPAPLEQKQPDLFYRDQRYQDQKQDDPLHNSGVVKLHDPFQEFYNDNEDLKQNELFMGVRYNNIEHDVPFQLGEQYKDVHDVQQNDPFRRPIRYYDVKPRPYEAKKSFPDPFAAPPPQPSPQPSPPTTSQASLTTAVTAAVTTATDQTTPAIIIEKTRPKPVVDFTIPGLDNGSNFENNGKIKDPQSNVLKRKFKFFG